MFSYFYSCFFAVFFLYFVFRAFFGRVSSIALGLLLYLILTSVSEIKQEHSGSPLVARDLFFAGQGFSLYEYIPYSLNCLVFLFILVACVAIFFSIRNRNNIFTIKRHVFACVPVLIVICKIYGVGSVNDSVSKMLSLIGFNFIEYNYSQNINDNGIILHLYQTAENVRKPEMGKHEFYKKIEYNNKLITSNKEQDVLFILCEACFTSKDSSFITTMSKLHQMGFSRIDMQSPVYGGGTAEAEFELLTGLSSKVLPGIDYQAYADLYRNGASTIASYFVDKKYKALSFHNYYDFFWRRNVVYPKFGFQASYFINNMAHGSWRGLGFPKDLSLYETAYKVYDGLGANDKAFMFIVTVETHGNYKDHNGDYGELDYLNKISSAMSSLNHFISDMTSRSQQKGHGLSIFIIGDHKPSLAHVFYERGVFPKNLFDEKSMLGGGWMLKSQLEEKDLRNVNSTPMFFRMSNPKDSGVIVDNLSDKPFFCLPAFMSQIASNDSLTEPFWLNLSSRCSTSDFMNGGAPEKMKKIFELPLFAERLF